jgi:hypothetical protein
MLLVKIDFQFFNHLKMSKKCYKMEIQCLFQASKRTSHNRTRNNKYIESIIYELVSVYVNLNEHFVQTFLDAQTDSQERDKKRRTAEFL